MNLNIIPNIRDEFGTLKTAIVSAFSAPEILAQAEGITRARAKELMTHSMSPPDLHAHLRYTELLRDRSIRLIYPHSPNIQPEDDYAGYVGTDLYCRDFLSAVGNRAILSNVSDYRNDSRVRYNSILGQIDDSYVSETDEMFTWGNAMILDDELLVGLEGNELFEDIAPPVTDPQNFQRLLQQHDKRRSGIQTITRILKEHNVEKEVTIVPKNSTEDLDIGLAPLPKRYPHDLQRALVYAPVISTVARDMLDARFDQIVLMEDGENTKGCNIVWLDPQTPVVSQEAVKTVRLLKGLGYDVQAMPLGTLKTSNKEKAVPGGWRCMTGVLERENDFPY